MRSGGKVKHLNCTGQANTKKNENLELLRPNIQPDHVDAAREQRDCRGRAYAGSGARDNRGLARPPLHLPCSVVDVVRSSRAFLLSFGRVLYAILRSNEYVYEYVITTLVKYIEIQIHSRLSIDGDHDMDENK